MAKDKKSFVLYCDLLKVVEKLILQDRENKTNYSGELFYHILQYVNDKDPIPIDFIIDLAFEPIKCQLKRDLVKYEVRQEQRTEAGKRSAELRKLNENKRKSTTVDDTSISCTVTVTDNVTVNGNVNDTVLHKCNGREEEIPPQIPKRFLLEISEVEEFLKSEQAWIEVICMQNKLTIEKVNNLIEEFVKLLRGRGESQKSPEDAKSHFYNWYNTNGKETTKSRDAVSDSESRKQKYAAEFESIVAKGN